jgi:hypothetical protein
MEALSRSRLRPSPVRVTSLADRWSYGGDVRQPRPVLLTAVTALPYPHLERATAGLRASLRHQLLATSRHAFPAWETLTVDGPVQVTDVRGRVWFEYRASLDGRGTDFVPLTLRPGHRDGPRFIPRSSGPRQPPQFPIQALRRASTEHPQRKRLVHQALGQQHTFPGRTSDPVLMCGGADQGVHRVVRVVREDFQVCDPGRPEQSPQASSYQPATPGRQVGQCREDRRHHLGIHRLGPARLALPDALSCPQDEFLTHRADGSAHRLGRLRHGRRGPFGAPRSRR